MLFNPKVCMKAYFLLTLTVFVFSCSSQEEKELIGQLKFITEKSANSKVIVDMASIANFAWDSLYFFNEYENAAYISDVIGFNWTGKPVENNKKRLLFVQNSKVISYVDYDFSELPIYLYWCNKEKQSYKRDEAKFMVLKTCDNTILIYSYIPLKCIDKYKKKLSMRCS